MEDKDQNIDLNKNDIKKKRELFDKQVLLLNNFLSNGAISKEQYEISLKGLKDKMGFKE